MEKHNSPIKVSLAQARKFLLQYHQIQPSNQISTKSGVLDYIKKVGCIQFDPVDVVGRSPDLALNARVKNYKIGDLDDLLYKDRLLLDGWDKVQSIFSTDDFPFFAKRRAHFIKHFKDANPAVLKLVPEIRQFIKENGPTSSIDLPYQEKVDWWWGKQKISKAALEILYHTSEVLIHHRVRSRRYFDLIENHLFSDILDKADPFGTVQEYEDAHVLRRIGGLGIARNKGTEHWLGILNVKSPERNAAVKRLLNIGKVKLLEIEGLEKEEYLIRTTDLDLLLNPAKIKPTAVFLPPLDNFMWDRGRLEQIFGFKYIWEIYKPATKREYGYYVLPVVYGNQIIARFDAKADRKNGVLLMNDWWFEEGVKPSKAMMLSIRSAVRKLAKLHKLNHIDYAPIYKEKLSTFYGNLSS